VKNFHPPAGRFDGIIGGPPCQAFSRLRHLVKHNGFEPAENLIPEFERCATEARPVWFLMENVPDAPEPEVAGYQVASHVVNNRWVGGVQNRTRRFSFGCQNARPESMWDAIQLEALESIDWAPTLCASDGGRSVTVKIGGSGKRKKMGASMLQDRSSRTFPSMRTPGLAGRFPIRSTFHSQREARSTRKRRAVATWPRHS
jgi:DNA (cytosine-5)-methyltransferase 1